MKRFLVATLGSYNFNNLYFSTIRYVTMSTSAATSAPLTVSRLDGAVALLRLNRPQQLNALNRELCGMLISTLKELDEDDSVRVFVLAGGQRAFAAGADIKEMTEIKSVDDALSTDLLAQFNDIKTIRKPIIASVKGFALGGGCELAMMCDIIYASTDAQFGQPELTLGTIPGMGGTQRLTSAIGKSKAMEWILSCKKFSAAEAERAGLVSKVISPPADVDTAAIELARKIASLPATSVRMAKECINRSLEVPLSEGILFEKRMFHATFSTAAREEGMRAFVEKRAPEFNTESPFLASKL